jgi:hypothetical protein
VLAAVAAQKVPDIGAGIGALRLDVREYEPADGVSVYDEAYAMYRDCFEALAPLWERPSAK